MNLRKRYFVMGYLIYQFPIDKHLYLLDVITVGYIISYVSIIFNIATFLILNRKNLFSPATILMQGLAVADGITTFASYGLEPLFQSQYKCQYDISCDCQMCDLSYPFCSVAVHLSILSMTFHTIAYMMTTSLGMQKVLAIQYPFWTKYHLTKRKTFIWSVLTFLLPIIISFPRHFAINFQNGEQFEGKCAMIMASSGVLEYTSIYYLLIQTLILACCCLIMILSTIFISYKLITNQFRGRMTEQRKQERRSVIMIVIVLLVFLLSEVPILILYLWFCVKYIAGDFIISIITNTDVSISLVVNCQRVLASLIVKYTDLVNGSYWNRFMTFAFLVEGIRIFILLGCLSNFIIYISMSRKMRKEILSLCKKTTNYQSRCNSSSQETNVTG